MRATLFPIPDKYFPGYKVTATFHAKVKYELKGTEIDIKEVIMSLNCLRCISNTAALTRDIEAFLKEKHAPNVHPAIMQSLSPFIK